MPDTCTLTVLAMPCPTCPWRLDATAQDIPNFDLEQAENLDYSSVNTAEKCHAEN